jgi:hypothetical protein
MLKDCGHFPVYFSSSKQGSFQVDREAQTKVMEDVKTFVEDGGHLSFYPEGQINREDINSLQPFRRGSFALALQHDMELWAFLMVGASECWPAHEVRAWVHIIYPFVGLSALLNFIRSAHDDGSVFCTSIPSNLFYCPRFGHIPEA